MLKMAKEIIGGNFFLVGLLSSFFLFASGCNNKEAKDSAKTKVSDQTDSIQLTFGIYTADKPSEVVAQFRPLLNSLEDELSASLGKTCSIKIDISPSYNEGIQRVVSEASDFSRLGPASYILAMKQNPKLKLLALESNKGSKTFNGVIAVHKDSEIKALSELKGQSFAFGDEMSTIGRYLSQLLLRKSGINARDLGSYEYLGRHDAVGAAIGNKRFIAGALKESTFKKLVAKGTPIKILAKFPNVTKPWIASGSLDTRIVAALKEALLKISDKEALKALGKQGFLEGSYEDYQMIKEAMDSNESFFDK